MRRQGGQGRLEGDVQAGGGESREAEVVWTSSVVRDVVCEVVCSRTFRRVCEVVWTSSVMSTILHSGDPLPHIHFLSRLIARLL